MRSPQYTKKRDTRQVKTRVEEEEEEGNEGRKRNQNYSQKNKKKKQLIIIIIRKNHHHQYNNNNQVNMKGRANRTKGRVCLAVIITKGEDYDKYERVTL